MDNVTTLPSTVWQPLLQGAEADQAQAAVRAIAHDLQSEPAPMLPLTSGGAGLASGSAGFALFYAYLAQAEANGAAEALALAHLENAFSDVEAQHLGASLYSGFCGVAWVASHLRGRLLEPEGDWGEETLDELLAQRLLRSPWREDYDLISGLVGLGVYALERLPNPNASVCLERIIDRLAECAIPQTTGITWWSDPAWLPPETQNRWPLGYFNTGLAHGVPGIIGFLGHLCARGVATAKACALLEGAVAWLLAQQLPPDAPSSFPYWVEPNRAPDPARLAWCYGDPGVATALLIAARGAHEPAWAEAARTVAHKAAARPIEEAAITDACLCHGAAGVAHIYNRLYQATGEEQFAATARFWFQQTLSMWQPGEGAGGFWAWEPSLIPGQTWVADPGLLNGAAGIGLALLAATTAVEPAWDRFMLIDVPTALYSPRR